MDLIERSIWYESAPPDHWFYCGTCGFALKRGYTQFEDWRDRFRYPDLKGFLDIGATGCSCDLPVRPETGRPECIRERQWRDEYATIGQQLPWSELYRSDARMIDALCFEFASSHVALARIFWHEKQFARILAEEKRHAVPRADRLILPPSDAAC